LEQIKISVGRETHRDPSFLETKSMKDERQKLEEAIVLQETLRGKVDDDIIDATITTLREKLVNLEITHDFPELQRKQVTIFFADIAGSTHIVQHLDPEDIQEIIVNTLQEMKEPIVEHGGRVIRVMGDGFLAIFGIPHAHEDDPERAIRAGLSILEIAQRVGPELMHRWNIPDFSIRIGINTGLVAISSSSEDEYTLMGSAVNLASRLETHAPPGGLLISHDTYRHVRGVFELDALEPVMLKGFDEPVSIYRVLGSRPRTFRVPSRGVEGVETRMVGRENELRILQDIFECMLEEAEGSIITITGEAGIGKSRLLYEFQNWIEFQPDVRFFQGRALQERQQTPFALLHDIFSFRFQIQDSDDLDRVHKKIEAGFGEIIGTEKSAIVRSHFIGQLLGFDFTNSAHLTGVLDDPQHLRERAIAHLRGYFEELTNRIPVVMFLEDIHWADDGSLELINQISSITQTNPLLIICMARPILYTHRPHWGEGLDYHQRLELKALNKKDSRNLVGEILKKVDQVPVALRELVVSWAEGNPFYIEELIKMMIENGVIVTGQESWRVIPEQLAQVNVPATLTGVLQARLDGLPNEERISLRLAAVIGRIFWEEAVNYLYRKLDAQETTNQAFQVTDALSSLRERELIYRREESTFSNTNEYLFKHSLLRDVAYENTPRRERRVYHKLSAKWLRDITSLTGRSDEYAARIADHYLLANESGAAVEWLYRAGLRARTQDAIKEARSYLTKALDLLPADDIEGRWQILLERDDILGILGDRDARLADNDTLVRIAEDSGDQDKLAEAYYRKGYFLYTLGRFQISMDACKKAIEAARQAGNRELEILASGIVIVNHKSLGEIRIATEKAESILETIEEHLDDKTLAPALANLATVYENQDIQKAIQLFERSVDILDRTGNHFLKAIGLVNVGYTYVMVGHTERGISALKLALEINKSIGSPRATIYSLLNLGLAYYRQGDHQSAIDVLMQAASAIKVMQDPVADAAYHTYHGLVSEQVQQPAQAVEHYETAARLFKQIGSLGYEQDAVAGLARAELSIQKVSEADRLANEVWDYLSKNGADGMEFPILAYLTCAQTFQAAQDRNRMLAAIVAGYNELIKRAEKFNDDGWRDTYLRAIPEHNAMLEMWTNNKFLIQQ
jgi:class 3 adenylate cyclase/tetratricopeptide (TPR) repeat protein